MRQLLICIVFVAVAQHVLAIPRWRESNGLKISKDEGSEWCDNVLGCLVLNDKWYWPNRPINVLPYSRERINTRFILHTRENPGEEADTYIKADVHSIDNSTFNPSTPTKIIVHGFIDTGFSSWLMEMTRALLKYGDYNVIRVDWGGGSLPMYYRAAANTRVVGLEIGHLVNFLIDNYNVDPANIHLLGHSLGAHASGYAGEQIAGLGRISGLDPAGPYYTNTASYISLDHTDAVYVDNIHSDADSILLLGYGTEQAMGNVDFYPNSGHGQPGCDPVTIGIELITDIIDGVRDFVACSHQRAIFLYIDSLLETSCPFMARKCRDYGDFETGRCESCGEDNSKCAFMGIHADEYLFKERVNTRMYFDTDDKSPFCYYHYQLMIDTSYPHEAESWVQGHLKVTLYGDNGEVIDKMKISKQHERFEHGQLKHFLIKSHKELSRVIRIEVIWNYDDTFINPGTYCWFLLCNRSLYLNSIRISPLAYYPEKNRLDHETTLCMVGSSFTEIKSGHTETLTADKSCKMYGNK